MNHIHVKGIVKRVVNEKPPLANTIELHKGPKAYFSISPPFTLLSRHSGIVFATTLERIVIKSHRVPTSAGDLKQVLKGHRSFSDPKQVSTACLCLSIDFFVSPNAASLPNDHFILWNVPVLFTPKLRGPKVSFRRFFRCILVRVFSGKGFKA